MKLRNIRLNPDKSHYLTSVLRCRERDTVTVIDGRGKAYTAAITGISPIAVSVDITAEIAVDTESPRHLVLCQGILKGEKMDMVVQKATELGVKEIFPVITERGIVKETRKVKRWRKIAEEAAEQCGRAVIPEVYDPISFRELLAGRGEPGNNRHGLIFYERGGLLVGDAVKKLPGGSIIDIFIGPEGGFTAAEVGFAEERGFIRATLGKRILRAETAAIVSAAIVQFLLEE